MSKVRLTVTVDPALLAHGQHAIASGAAESMSAWVSTALEERVARDVRLEAMKKALDAYEAEFGPIGLAEIAAQREADLRAAVPVRGRRA